VEKSIQKGRTCAVTSRSRLF